MEKYLIIGLAVLIIAESAVFVHREGKCKESIKKMKHELGLAVGELDFVLKRNERKKAGVFGKDAKGDIHRFVYLMDGKIVSVSHGFRHKSFSKEQVEKFFSNSTRTEIFKTFSW